MIGVLITYQTPLHGELPLRARAYSSKREEVHRPAIEGIGKHLHLSRMSFVPESVKLQLDLCKSNGILDFGGNGLADIPEQVIGLCGPVMELVGLMADEWSSPQRC